MLMPIKLIGIKVFEYVCVGKGEGDGKECEGECRCERKEK